MDNIDQFNLSAGVVLAKLFQSFPRRITLSDAGLCGLSGYKPVISASGLHTGAYISDDGVQAIPDPDEAQMYRDTISWLEEFGFITGVTKSWGIESATLTPAGLAMMNADSQCNQDKRQSWGVRIVKALLESAKDEAADFTGKAIASFAKGMISS